MDAVSTEIGHKMRSAIKAKLTELGCYVDDELPDYVMVMVANKRTREQMEDDLQLFLGDNTELFVNWLHQVLKKLQEVTVPAPSSPKLQTSKEKSKSKDKKSKEKKSKEKKSEIKKSKKKDKNREKILRKKEERKSHKKKKSKHSEMIRPNIPPLLMNMEKESEPSITDVFAGQILKNHGILMDAPVEKVVIDEKPETKDLMRPIVPIIDPATILSEPTETDIDKAPQEEKIKEINKIEAKIQGLKHKLAKQLDAISDDEDFLNIRAEADELMNEFADDVYQEISAKTPVATSAPLSQSEASLPILPPSKTPPPKSPNTTSQAHQHRPLQSPTIEDLSPLHSPPIKVTNTAHLSSPMSPPPKPPPPPPPPKPAENVIETLPQIELNLPKRPVRERLGIKEDPKKFREPDKDSPKSKRSSESFTPDRELAPARSQKSAKSRLGEPTESKKKISTEESGEKSEPSSKRLTSKVSVLENRSGRSSCASVVRVRPRPRIPAPASSLLMRAVADAHKSLLNIPPKIDQDSQKVKRALVLPMRRSVDTQKIVIQVAGDARTDDTEQDTISLGEPDSEDDKSSKVASECDKEEYMPRKIFKKIHDGDYMPRRLEGRTSVRKENTLIIETLNIHNTTVDKDKKTQFIVTMDGFNPNTFLAKKLETEGLLDEDEPMKSPKASKPTEKDNAESHTTKEKDKQSIYKKNESKSEQEDRLMPKSENEASKTSEVNKTCQVDKTSEISKSSNVTISEAVTEEKADKRKSTESLVTKQESPPTKRRKSSPIVFNATKKDNDADKERQRTDSVGSDNHVTVTTTSTHKYDALPPLTIAEKKLAWCRAFPQCRYGSTCAFQHPRCKFAAACTRRSCPYSHALTATTPLSPAPVLASHVIPAANYKSITTSSLPAMCKYYPACVNPACAFFHPKPCRYGKSCANKLECNFYHAEFPAAKWRYPV